MPRRYQSGRVRAAKEKTGRPFPSEVSFRFGRVVYIHGAGNQPAPSILKQQWDRALFGNEVGDRTRMVMWVNRNVDPVSEGAASGEWVENVLGNVEFPRWPRESPSLDDFAASLTANAEQSSFLREVASQLRSGVDLSPSPDVRRVTQGAPDRASVVQWHWRIFLCDLAAYLFDSEQRERIQSSLRDRLQPGTPVVVLSHGLGSLISYDVLSGPDGADLDVRLWVTLGAPLGIPRIRQTLRDTHHGRLEAPDCVDQWQNVFDPADPIASAGGVADAFSRVQDVKVEKQVQNPQSATDYLRAPVVRRLVRDLVGYEFGQATGRFQVAKDLVHRMENEPGRRQHVLIELAEVQVGESLQHNAQLVLDELARVLPGDRRDAAKIEVLKRYIAAELTRSEIEDISRTFERLKIARMWHDSQKTSLIWQSLQTIQGRAASVGYGASGRGICWAVLDSGVAGDHPHFQEFNNIEVQWDCTQPLTDEGTPVQLSPRGNSDPNGHGTHVTGIIAGRSRRPYHIEEVQSQEVLSGMAPECRIHSYRVLDDYGRGRDSWIIKALDHIAEVNESVGRLVIHGVNLSLGGPFDASVYGCGHSPLCQELRRLWRGGVLVCVPVGNEGLEEIETTRGPIPANQDVTIVDPANLEECIAVGSVHKANPHTYGISYFSSRGPTADGRLKPDVVAPGERIISASSRFPEGSEEFHELYVERSGTSMAAPHVSGLLAAYLSIRRGFIGQPDRVKEILLSNCTSLNRDPYFQGRGLPNLVKMLALS